ncbi:aminoglycoside adenylyltransferase domain-containing protein [Culicoidibacter larvae]|uniref:DUF4111 domain-containing protein n=1 Tax=Culicoidibacter larvae TaxID=2579976 RepID=A0A5R8Q887_9FIRM|nr:TetR-like C-terminal domain-containing protein [Culicoidibacter larvae]TLG71794.1 hypothetical protein FEZ08_10320 [Culicoidibacter larvae]
MMTKPMLKSMENFLTFFTGVHQQHLGDNLGCVALYGSIANSAYIDGVSDIDFVVFTKVALSDADMKQLYAALQEHPFYRKLDGMYLLAADAGKMNEALVRYYYLDRGQLEFGYWDVNAVTWWSLVHGGIVLFGTLPDIEISWEQVIKTMQYNIDKYWLPKVNKPWNFYSDEDFEFAMATVCRIYVTIREARIVPKVEAMQIVAKLHPQYAALISQAIALREQTIKPRNYYSRVMRMREAMVVLKKIIGDCQNLLAEQV